MENRCQLIAAAHRRATRGDDGASDRSLRPHLNLRGEHLSAAAAMSHSKSRGDDSDDLTRPPPPQAILLADSFTLKFRPITLDTRPENPKPPRRPSPSAPLNSSAPQVLLPLVKVPMIEYTLTWLETAGVEWRRSSWSVAPGEGGVDREASGRENGRLVSRVARRYQRPPRHVRSRRGEFCSGFGRDCESSCVLTTLDYLV
jgi:hypothetical protein